VHGVARILSEPQEILLDQECLPLPDRLADFTGAGHNLLTRKFGLSYGPAFQCLDYGWVEQESALAVFKIPEKIAGELEQSHLHPALLDCTLQLIFQLFRNEKDVDNGISFVPTRMGRIAFRKTPGKPAFARATLLRRAPHSLTGEFVVFADDGKAIAVVKDVRFRSIRLSRNAEDSFSFLDYHGIPQPHVFDFQRAAFIPYKTVQSAFIEPVKCIARTQSIHRYVNEVDPLLDILCSQFTREALQRLSADGHNLTSQKILVFQQANPEIEPFLAHLLFQAEDDQSIIRNSDG
jgi:hypothetical protein